MITPEEKATFTRVENTAKNSAFVYSNDTILYSDRIFVRKNVNLRRDKWEEIEEIMLDGKEKYKKIGFIPYEMYLEEVKLLKEEIDLIKRSKAGRQIKYRSKKNYVQQKKRIATVMKDVIRMKKVGHNESLETQIKDTVNWHEDISEREIILKTLYNKSFDKSKSKSEIYSYFKQFSILKLLYDEKFKKNDEEKSQFHIELKGATGKSTTIVTKFVAKIDLITKFFKILPPGSWAFCTIPLTYWLLIYREFWDLIFECVSNDNEFPYDNLFKDDVILNLGLLDLNKDDEINEEDEDEVNEEDEVGDEEDE
jgi:hypothetical protein